MIEKTWTRLKQNSVNSLTNGIKQIQREFYNRKLESGESVGKFVRSLHQLAKSRVPKFGNHGPWPNNQKPVYECCSEWFTLPVVCGIPVQNRWRLVEKTRWIHDQLGKKWKKGSPLCTASNDGFNRTKSCQRTWWTLWRQPWRTLGKKS